MKYVKQENPFRAGGIHASMFSYMQKNQTYTIEGLTEFCINRLHLTPKRAREEVYLVNSPREKSHNGSDPRGNHAAYGHLWYAEILERKWVAGIRQPQYYRLRWRKYLLEAKRRKPLPVVEAEKIIPRVEKIKKEKV